LIASNPVQVGISKQNLYQEQGSLHCFMDIKCTDLGYAVVKATEIESQQMH